ncbi:hypothetical protein EON82_17750 [bacterium]|nr:MAG: hypothetical protein EON82_17750 [bacterium]
MAAGTVIRGRSWANGGPPKPCERAGRVFDGRQGTAILNDTCPGIVAASSSYEAALSSRLGERLGGPPAEQPDGHGGEGLWQRVPSVGDPLHERHVPPGE